MEANKRPLEAAAPEAGDNLRAEIIEKEKSVAAQAAKGATDESLAGLRAECQKLREEYQQVVVAVV